MQVPEKHETADRSQRCGADSGSAKAGRFHPYTRAYHAAESTASNSSRVSGSGLVCMLLARAALSTTPDRASWAMPQARSEGMPSSAHSAHTHSIPSSAAASFWPVSAGARLSCAVPGPGGGACEPAVRQCWWPYRGAAERRRALRAAHARSLPTVRQTREPHPGPRWPAPDPRRGSLIPRLRD